MKKDSLYKNAPAFMNDGQIWLLKVLKLYFVNQVLRFNYQDFMTAIKDDLPPLISYMGLWIMETWLARVKEIGDQKEFEKQIKVGIEIIKTILEKGIKHFEKESKYHLANKYSPKKFPEQAIARKSVNPLYSYKIYARPEYFQNLEQEAKEEELLA